MRIVKNVLVFLSIVTIGIALISSIMPRRANVELTVYFDEMDETTDSLAEYVNLMDSVKNALILEVEKYIFKRYPKTNKNLPTLIVEHGLEKEVDILFMMAQTQIETSFGTAGAGRETSRRSLFGVAVRKYDSYEKAIEDYLRILKKNYLRRGRTEQHLMKNYTTTGGARYAANPNYENELSAAYSSIKRKTKIMELQEKYKNFLQ